MGHAGMLVSAQRLLILVLARRPLRCHANSRGSPRRGESGEAAVDRTTPTMRAQAYSRTAPEETAIPRSMKVRNTGVLSALGLFACEAESTGREGTLGAAEGTGKADDGAFPGVADVDPGGLTWVQLQTPAVSFDGKPLFVSNNPEVFDGYGVLAAAQGGSPIGWGQRSSQAPAGTWNGAMGSSQCEDGHTEFGVYLAHIRGRNLSSAAVSVVLEAPKGGANVTVRGDVGTTDWSQNGAYLTTRESWLSAAIAKTFFYGAQEERSYILEEGKPTVIASQTARSLVEGRLHVSAADGRIRWR